MCKDKQNWKEHKKLSLSSTSYKPSAVWNQRDKQRESTAIWKKHGWRRDSSEPSEGIVWRRGDRKCLQKKFRHFFIWTLHFFDLLLSTHRRKNTIGTQLTICFSLRQLSTSSTNCLKGSRHQEKNEHRVELAENIRANFRVALLSDRINRWWDWIDFFRACFSSCFDFLAKFSFVLCVIWWGAVERGCEKERREKSKQITIIENKQKFAGDSRNVEEEEKKERRDWNSPRIILSKTELELRKI